MAAPRPFGPSNKPGTCLWCGTKLRQDGYYQRGFFCTASCGFRFACRLAELGRRFKPVGEDD